MPSTPHARSWGNDLTVQASGRSEPVKRERGSSLLKNTERPPHLRVVRPERAHFRLAARGADATGRLIPLLWINHPDRPRRQPVTVSATQTTDQPLYVLTRPRLGSRITEAKDPHGQVLVSVRAHRFRSVVQTHWTVHSANGTKLFSISERFRDALWRRTIGVASRLDGDAFILAIPGMALSFFKGPVQMTIRDGRRNKAGVVTFSPGLFKPREDFSIYLGDAPFPLDNPELTAGILAAMQRTV